MIHTNQTRIEILPDRRINSLCLFQCQLFFDNYQPEILCKKSVTVKSCRRGSEKKGANTIGVVTNLQDGIYRCQQVYTAASEPVTNLALTNGFLHFLSQLLCQLLDENSLLALDHHPDNRLGSGEPQ